MHRALLVGLVTVVGASCQDTDLEEAAARHGTNLELTAAEIRLGGEPLLLVSDVLRFDYLNIPRLEDELRELRKASPEARPCAGIAAPADATFRMAKRLAFTCKVAGHTEVAFSLAPGQAPRPLDALPAGPRDFPAAHQKADSIVLTPTELRPRIGERRLDAIPGAPPAAALAALRAATTQPQRDPAIRLLIEDDVSLARLFDVKEALERAGFAVVVRPGG